MKFSASALGAAVVSLLVSGASATRSHADRDESDCAPPDAIPDLTGTDFRNVGVVMFNGIDMVDVYGTLDPFYMLALLEQQLKLYLIAETLDNVTPRGSMNPCNSSFYPEFVVTNTFDDDLDIDLLIVPGGSGVRAPDTSAAEAYLQKMFPKVKVFMTICTGSGLAAKSGVLDGHMATTNKKAWAQMTGWGPDVRWVSPARYVVDGKVWTSSGVTSGMDLSFAFIEAYSGRERAEYIWSMLEHEPREWDDDPFHTYFGLENTETQPCPWSQPLAKYYGIRPRAR